MPLYVSVPDGTGPFPALVVIHHQTGVDEFIQGMAQRLAGAGYVAAVPDLYHRDGPDCQDDPRTRSQRLSDRRVTNDIEATVKFLQNHRAVVAKRIGIIGFCMGGRVVYLSGRRKPGIQSGSNLLSGQHRPCLGSRYSITLRTHRGDPLPDPRTLW